MCFWKKNESRAWKNLKKTKELSNSFSFVQNMSFHIFEWISKRWCGNELTEMKIIKQKKVLKTRKKTEKNGKWNTGIGALRICSLGSVNFGGFLMQILGALVTHVGSGISFEVTSALDTMVLLVSKYAHELVPLSSHINGILTTSRLCT